MIEWLKRQLRKITAFVIALYLAIVTLLDERGREQPKCPRCNCLDIYRPPKSAQRLCMKCGHTWFPTEIEQ